MNSPLNVSASRRFQPGEGPNGGLLRDCENRWIICSSNFKLSLKNLIKHNDYGLRDTDHPKIETT